MVVTRTRNDAGLQETNGATVWFALLLLSLLFSACGKSAPLEPPVQVQDLQLRSQERLFHSAKSDFLAARYSQAIQSLQRFLSTYPRSTYEAEVMWFLARAYHKSGNIKAALKQYRQVVGHEGAAEHHQEAQRYMEELHARLTPPPSSPIRPPAPPPSPPHVRPPAEVFALQMTFRQWREGRDWNTRLKNMSRRGVTTQLINLECGMMRKDVAGLFESPLTKVVDGSKDPKRFTSFVKQAHEYGLTIFLGVNVRCLGQLDIDSGTRWADRAYDQQSKALRSTQYFDVFNREYQKFLKDILVQLAGSGIDGIVFLGDAPMGMFDGVTPIALKKFQQAFGLSFQPQKVFASKSVKGKRGRRVAIPKESEFWRWIGWRARAQLTVLQDLMSSVKQSHHKVQVALELYAGGLNDPLRTLLQLNEDVLESHHLDFSFLVVDVDGPQHMNAVPAGLRTRSRQESLSRIAQRFLEVFKDPSRLWLTVPRKLGLKAWSSDSLKELTGDANVPQGIGLVYDLRPFS